MTVSEIVDVFKDVADNYSAVKRFIYGQTWDMNGDVSNECPAILLEAQPDWTEEGRRPSGKPIKKTYTFKLFGYDTYFFDEQATKELWTVQGELEDIFENYIAKVTNEIATKKGWSISIMNNGFHGFYPSNNSKLIQVYQGLKISIPVECLIP